MLTPAATNMPLVMILESGCQNIVILGKNYSDGIFRDIPMRYRHIDVHNAFGWYVRNYPMLRWSAQLQKLAELEHLPRGQRCGAKCCSKARGSDTVPRSGQGPKTRFPVPQNSAFQYIFFKTAPRMYCTGDQKMVPAGFI